LRPVQHCLACPTENPPVSSRFQATSVCCATSISVLPMVLLTESVVGAIWRFPEVIDLKDNFICPGLTKEIRNASCSILFEKLDLAKCGRKKEVLRARQEKRMTRTAAASDWFEVL